MPTTLRIVTGTIALVGLVAADGVLGRDLGLGDRGRPQAGQLAVELGDVAGGEDRRVVGAHAVVDEHAAVDPQLRVAGELDVRLDARRDEQDLRLRCCGRRCRCTARRRPLASTRLDLGLEQDLEPEPFEVVAQDARPRARRAGGAAGDRERSSTTVLSPSLCSAYAASRPSRPPPATTRAARATRWAKARRRDRVGGRAQDAGPVGAEALDRRHEAARAGGEDQPVVVQPLAGAERDLALRRGRSHSARVFSHAVIRALLVPGVGVEVEALHRASGRRRGARCPSGCRGGAAPRR